MTDKPVTTPMRVMLRACAWILPQAMREEWVTEWVGEIAGARDASDSWGWWTELRMLPGAVADATATRRFRWEIEKARNKPRMGWEGTMELGLEGWWSDLRHAAQGLRSRPGFAFTATLTLALGVGATTAVFSAVNSVLLVDLPYGDSERVVVIREMDTRDGSLSEGVSAPNLYDIADASRTSAYIGMADGVHGLRLVRDGRAESLRTWVVSEGYFAALDAHPVLGRLFGPDEYGPGGRQVVVLSQGAWQNRFGGDTEVIGREIVLDDVAHRVVGILPAAFRYPSAVEAWTPRARPQGNDEPRGRASMRAVAQLRPGVDLSEAQSELDRIARELSLAYPETNEHTAFQLIPLREHLLGDVESPLKFLMGAVILVLMIASANVAGLQVARSASRAREDAVRAALGATRGRVIRLVVAESLLLALAGGGAGVAVAYLGVDLIQILGPDHLPRIDELRIDRTVLGFALLTSLGSALVAGIAPALTGSKVNLRSVLSGSARGSTGGRGAGSLRDALVVGEIATALVLTVGAGLLLNSFARVLDTDLGFDPTGLVATQVWAYDDQHESEFDYFERGAEVLRALPGVESVGITSNLPLADDDFLLARPLPVSFDVAQRSASSNAPETVANLSVIDEAYPEAMDIEVTAGRVFTSGDGRETAPVVLVNEAFVRRYFQDEDPIGAQLTLQFRGGRTREIVGVLRDVRRRGFESAAGPEVYVPLAQEPFNGLTFVIRTQTDASTIVGSVREALWRADPSQAIWANRPVTDMLSEWTSQRTFNTALLSAFAALALALSAIGVYGLMAFSVEERVREFGVRRALGGTSSTILGTVLRKGIPLAGSGIALGSIGALGLSRLLRGMLFGIEPFDPLTFLAVAAVVVCIAIAAALLPAYRATRVDPLVALSGAGR